MKIRSLCLVAGLCAILSAAPEAETPNMLKNGDFGKLTKGGMPEAWGVGNRKHKLTLDKEDKPEGCAQSARIEVSVTGKFDAYLSQVVKGLDPSATYVVEAHVKGSVPGAAYVQIKRNVGKKKLGRVTSKPNRKVQVWTPVKLKVTGCETALVMCRYDQKEKAVGRTVWFAGVKMYPQPAK